MAATLEAVGAAPLSNAEGALRHAARGLPLHAKDGSVRAWAIVDAEDYPWLSQYHWSFIERHRYARRRGSDGRTVLLHRQVLGLTRGDGMDADHINFDRLDNRRANLRRTTRAQNSQNRRVRDGGTSSHRGVTWDKGRQKWVAQATLNYKNHHIGRFDSEEEAAEAAAAWRRQHMPFSNERSSG